MALDKNLDPFGLYRPDCLGKGWSNEVKSFY